AGIVRTSWGTGGRPPGVDKVGLHTDVMAVLPSGAKPTGANDTHPGGFVSEFYGVDSEVGRLRTVLVHRPGAELRRVTPQQRCGMLLPNLPWAERAQAEHDAFADALRGAG